MKRKAVRAEALQETEKFRRFGEVVRVVELVESSRNGGWDCSALESNGNVSLGSRTTLASMPVILFGEARSQATFVLNKAH
jgi:hypothetical protein